MPGAEARATRAGAGTATGAATGAEAGAEAGATRAGTPAAGVVVPVRAFALGKSRLGSHLGADERAGLVRAMADRVVSAAGELPVAVVTGDAEVARWASGRGVLLVDDPGGLDAAVAAGVSAVAALGVARVVVAHGDLPEARSLAGLADPGSLPLVVAVPCHRDDGTPVLSLPAADAARFGFAYGPGSFRRHLAEARRLGLAVRVVRRPDLRHDVDRPDDLLHLLELPDLPVPGPSAAAPSPS